MIGKFEIRNSKLEANSNSENRIGETSSIRISDMFRPAPAESKFEIRVFIFVLALLLGLSSSLAQPRRLEQPPPLSPAEGAREAKALVAEMLAEKPEQNSTNVGVLKIRNSEGNQHQIPLKIVTLITRTNWLQIYEASATPSSSAITLTIVHTSENANQYFLSSSANSAPKPLSPADLMAPFAGSDFWIADLGYEFLHWPKQTRIVKIE